MHPRLDRQANRELRLPGSRRPSALPGGQGHLPMTDTERDVERFRRGTARLWARPLPRARTARLLSSCGARCGPSFRSNGGGRSWTTWRDASPAPRPGVSRWRSTPTRGRCRRRTRLPGSRTSSSCEPWPPSRPCWSWSIAGLLFLRGPDGKHDPGYRQPGSEAIRSLLPENEPVSRADLRLRWSPGPEGTRYDVRVTTESLETVASARSLVEASFVVPESALSSLPAGQPAALAGPDAAARRRAQRLSHVRHAAEMTASAGIMSDRRSLRHSRRSLRRPRPASRSRPGRPTPRIRRLRDRLRPGPGQRERFRRDQRRQPRAPLRRPLPSSSSGCWMPTATRSSNRSITLNPGQSQSVRWPRQGGVPAQQALVRGEVVVQSGPTDLRLVGTLQVFKPGPDLWPALLVPSGRHRRTRTGREPRPLRPAALRRRLMNRRLVHRTGLLALAASLLAGGRPARADPFSGCAAQFAARPDDYPSSYCFFLVAQQEKRWEEAARRLDALRAQPPSELLADPGPGQPRVDPRSRPRRSALPRGGRRLRPGGPRGR